LPDSSSFSFSVLVLLALLLDLLDEFALVLGREDLGLLFELELLDLLFELLEVLALVEFEVLLALLDFVEQLVGLRVQLVADLLVLLDLLVELVALFAVFLGLVDLLAGRGVELVALGGSGARELVQFVPSVAELTGVLDELPLDFSWSSSSVMSSSAVDTSIVCSSSAIVQTSMPYCWSPSHSGRSESSTVRSEGERPVILSELCVNARSVLVTDSRLPHYLKFCVWYVPANS